MASVIFITKGGPYPDEWLGDEVEFIRPMRWYGQNKGRKDHLVRPGTFVAMREKKTARSFTIVGVVETIEKVEDGKPSMYRLNVRMQEPEMIPRAPGDKFTHSATLRRLGIPVPSAGVAEGIYSA